MKTKANERRAGAPGMGEVVGGLCARKPIRTLSMAAMGLATA